MNATTGEPDRTGMCVAGKYCLEAPLAEGGSGRVYRARHELLGREVAVKILLAEHAARPELVSRFVREARLATAVRHPNIVEVLDVGIEPSGLPYMVQELLSGRPLDEYVRERGGSLGADETLTLMELVIDAVAFAHARGVTHRDLKPENVFLVYEGRCVRPKVLDFGISRRVTPERVEGDSMVGLVCGTPLYMSPEQSRGEPTDARADVWSLGVMMHELLSGTLPFPGNTEAAVLAGMFFDQSIPLEVSASDVPADIRRIVVRCLQRDPSKRYPSARELLADLRTVMRGRGLPPASDSDPSGSPAGRWDSTGTDLRASGGRITPGARRRVGWTMASISVLLAAAVLGFHVRAGTSLPNHPAGESAPTITDAVVEPPPGAHAPRGPLPKRGEPAHERTVAAAASAAPALAPPSVVRHASRRVHPVRRVHHVETVSAGYPPIPTWSEAMEYESSARDGRAVHE